MKFILSIIIPVYNVETYIQTCLKSLFSQDRANEMEFIIVNDASTDRSLEKATEVISTYRHLKSNIKLISHQQNKGLVATRITGTKQATGKYIIQCDSDDWVDTNLYATMLSVAEEEDPDIIGCDFVDEYTNRSSIRKQVFTTGEYQVINMLLGNPHFAGSLCNRMYKRDFYITYRPEIPLNLSMCEDLAISITLHMRAKRVSKVYGTMYHYRHRESSITTTISKEFVESWVNAVTFIADLVMNENNYNYNVALDVLKHKAKLPYIYNIETYDNIKWKNTFPNLSRPSDIGLLPMISIMLEQYGLSFINKLLIKLRHVIRR